MPAGTGEILNPFKSHTKEYRINIRTADWNTVFLSKKESPNTKKRNKVNDKGDIVEKAGSLNETLFGSF